MDFKKHLRLLTFLVMCLLLTTSVLGQGVTTSGLSGLVMDENGKPLQGANVIATHEPSGTLYGAAVRAEGAYTIPNMRIGGPYSVKVTFIGYKELTEEDVLLRLGQTMRLDFQLTKEAIDMEAVEVIGQRDEIMNSDRNGAATFVGADQVAQMPSIKRSTRDLTRLDPRSDGNFSFGGRNWLYNNISLDGSYFNNSFGLDDPAPGGQTNAEPVPYDAVEQVQISIAPFDVREGGFTGAGINTVTKSGTNQFRGSVYSFMRNENLTGNKVNGEEVSAIPDLTYNQSGFTFSGPIIQNKIFFFVNAELERRDDPGSPFVADQDGTVKFGESRVEADVMDAIRQRMMDVYDYDTGPYEDYTHATDNNKLLVKLDWNISQNHKFTFRYNLLDAVRDLPPHGFVLSYNNTGRGPNSSSLPFENSGYAINNELNSYAAELNSTFGGKMANKLFFSYNRFRDFRDPFSEDFPTVEIGEDGVTYTTVGHEPFSIHNILDQDVLQITDNFSYFMGKHVFTLGLNYEQFKFFNSFNIFRHGLFQLDASWATFLGGTTFSTLDDFLAATDPALPDSERVDFRSMVGTGPYKGEEIDFRQFSVYAQDEFMLTPALNLSYGLRIDIPIYKTEPVENSFSTSLTCLDENDKSETVDQAKLPDSKPLFSPRLGFNWDVTGDRSFQLRGGTGIFTGRMPFVWYGNVISNPGTNPKLYPGIAEADLPDDHETDDGKDRLDEGRSILQQSFDLNAMVPDFKLPQVWTTDFAVDKKLPGNMLGTLELIYGKDINAIYMRNADLVEPVGYLDDGRPYYGAKDLAHELNTAYPGENAGVYVIDNTNEGHNLTITAQLRKFFKNGLETSFAYTYLNAKNNLKSTEIASVLWQSQPVQGDPNTPNISYSEFGNPHRFIGTANYRHQWSDKMATSFGLFMEVAQGNRYIYSGGNRYSFIYSGDVNGDGYGGNDLIHIPDDESEITLQDVTDSQGAVTYSAADQWSDLDAFIKQDDYLSSHRGEIAERNGALNPWFSNIDLRVLQDFYLNVGGHKHTFQFSFDILNFGNLINDGWGVRKIASSSATSPLTLVGWDANDEPVFNFNGPEKTFIDDPSIYSRWRVQIGLRYIF